MLDVELVVIVKAKLLSEEFQIFLADDEGARLSHPADDALLLVYFAGILVCLVEEAEARHLHKVEAVDVFQLQVKISHDVRGEVEACHLVEQLVLVKRVGVVCDDEEELLVAVVGECSRCDGVAVVEHDGASAPHVAQVEVPTMEALAGFHAVDDHAGHFAYTPGGEVLHHLVHVGQAALCIIVVETAETSDEEELVAVGSQWEACFGKLGVGHHLLVAVGAECLVGGGV